MSQGIDRPAEDVSRAMLQVVHVPATRMRALTSQIIDHRVEDMHLLVPPVDRVLVVMFPRTAPGQNPLPPMSL